MGNEPYFLPGATSLLPRSMYVLRLYVLRLHVLLAGPLSLASSGRVITCWFHPHGHAAAHVLYAFSVTGDRLHYSTAHLPFTRMDEGSELVRCMTVRSGARSTRHGTVPTGEQTMLYHMPRVPPVTESSLEVALYSGYAVSSVPTGCPARGVMVNPALQLR